MFFQPGHSKRKMSSLLLNDAWKNHPLTAPLSHEFTQKGGKGLADVNVFQQSITFKVSALDLPPTQDASQHKDYYIFSGEDPDKPSFSTVTGWG